MLIFYVEKQYTTVQGGTCYIASLYQDVNGAKVFKAALIREREWHDLYWHYIAFSAHMRVHYTRTEYSTSNFYETLLPFRLQRITHGARCFVSTNQLVPPFFLHSSHATLPCSSLPAPSSPTFPCPSLFHIVHYPAVQPIRTIQSGNIRRRSKPHPRSH